VKEIVLAFAPVPLGPPLRCVVIDGWMRWSFVSVWLPKDCHDVLILDSGVASPSSKDRNALLCSPRPSSVLFILLDTVLPVKRLDMGKG
jgi:hypothetical protein